MVDYNEIKHKGTNEIRYVSGSFSDTVYKGWGNWHVELLSVFSKGFEFQVVEFIVLLDFLFDVFIIVEQRYQLVPLSIPTYLKHNGVLGILCQVLKNRMVREVQVLESRLTPIEWWYFNLDYKSLELFHQDIEISVLVLTIVHQVQSECSSLKGLLVFNKVWILLITECFFLSSCSIVVNLFQ